MILRLKNTNKIIILFLSLVIFVSIMVSFFTVSTFARSVDDFFEDCPTSEKEDGSLRDSRECRALVDLMDFGCDSEDFSVYDEIPGCHIIETPGANYYCSITERELIPFTNAANLVEVLDDRGLIIRGANDGPDELTCENDYDIVLNDGIETPFFVDSQFTSENNSGNGDCTTGNTWTADINAIRGVDGGPGAQFEANIRGGITCPVLVDNEMMVSIRFVDDNSARETYIVQLSGDGSFNRDISFSITDTDELLESVGSSGTYTIIIEEQSGIGLNQLSEVVELEDEESTDPDVEIGDTPEREENDENGGRIDPPGTGEPAEPIDPLEACGEDLSDSAACRNCINNGGVWGQLGCIDPTPTGLTTRLIQIALGVMGGVALIQMIIVGIQYQSGQQDKIEEARKRLLTTIGGIAFLMFSVLILRIIGVDILDILPEGSV